MEQIKDDEVGATAALPLFANISKEINGSVPESLEALPQTAYLPSIKELLKFIVKYPCEFIVILEILYEPYTVALPEVPTPLNCAHATQAAFWVLPLGKVMPLLPSRVIDIFFPYLKTAMQIYVGLSPDV